MMDLLQIEKILSLYTEICRLYACLLLDTRNMVISVVHSGWKGSFQKIACKALGKMCQSYNTKTEDIGGIVRVGISLNIMRSGRNFWSNFKLRFLPRWFGKFFKRRYYYYDNQEFISQSLLKRGKSPENIFRNTLCSFEGNYHSYRKDREQAEKQASYTEK